MSEVDQVLAEMAGLRALFLADVPAMTEEIERLLTAVGADPQGLSREPLIRTVHSLAGTSATFGLPGIAQAARHLEELLEAEGAIDIARCEEGLRHVRMAVSQA